MPISIGSSAIDREFFSNNAVYDQCYIEANPATETGTVRRVRIFITGSIGGTLQVGSMYKTNGNTFTSRDWGIVTTPSAGLNEYTQWQHLGAGGTVDIEMEVQSGDYIAVRMRHAATGNGVDVDTSGAGRWRTLSEDVTFPFTNKEFDFLANQTMSLNGDFMTVGGEDSVVFPTDAITRVTNLIHRYNRKEGEYSLTISLGEVTSDFGLPQWLSRPQPSVPEKVVDGATIEESVQAAVDKALYRPWEATPPEVTKPKAPTEPSITTIPLVELPQILREAKATAKLATLQAQMDIFNEAIRLRKLEDKK